jgi:hypothetical protein
MGRELLDRTRDSAAFHDELRWLREDLEESLLDVKLGVHDADAERIGLHLAEANALISVILHWIDDNNQPGE